MCNSHQQAATALLSSSNHVSGKMVFRQNVDLSITACMIVMLSCMCESDGVDDIGAGAEPGEILVNDTKDTLSGKPTAAPSKPAGALNPQHAEHMATILGTIPAHPHAAAASSTPVPRQAQNNDASEGLLTGQQPTATVQHLPADAMLEDAATSSTTADGGSSPSTATAAAAEQVYGLKWAVPVAVSFMAMTSERETKRGVRVSRCYEQGFGQSSGDVKACLALCHLLSSQPVPGASQHAVATNAERCIVTETMFNTAQEMCR